MRGGRRGEQRALRQGERRRRVGARPERLVEPLHQHGGVGRVYAQTFIDANAAVGFAKLYLSKVPMTAVDLLHERVLPFYEAQGVRWSGH